MKKKRMSRIDASAPPTKESVPVVDGVPLTKSEKFVGELTPEGELKSIVKVPAAETLVEPTAENVSVNGTDEDVSAPGFPAAEMLIEPPAVKEEDCGCGTGGGCLRPSLKYLGTRSIAGMKGRGASLPIVVRVDGASVGVIVVTDPGLIGESLRLRIAEENGYENCLVHLVKLESMDKQTKLAAARVLISQSDPSLDRAGAIMALGFSMSQLSSA